MDKNKVTVEIFSEKYALKGDMNAETVKALAKTVDDEMRKVARSNQRLPAAKVAVLAALNICSEYKKLEQDYKQLLEMIKNE